MLARLESLLHRARRRLSRSEWAIRHLGLPPSEGTGEAPGLVLLQIDGLSRRQFERALAAGRLPYLARLLRREGCELHTFYPGLPTTTPAVQAELYYGVHSAVPAFSFLNRREGRLGRMWDPEWAKSREAECARQAEGLLRGGSSWSNMYTGGADQAESHFCAASIGLGDMWREKKFRSMAVFVLLHFPAVLRICWLMLLEFGVALADMVRAVARGGHPYKEFVLVLSRVLVGVCLQEVMKIAGQIDVARGLPIVHLNFVSYDEKAHVRGPDSRLAHRSLRSIDRAVKWIARAAHRSARRDYAVWVFSDHGQEPTRPFSGHEPGGIEAAIHRCLETARRKDAPWRDQSQAWITASHLSRGRLGQARLERERARDRLTHDESTTFTVAAMGPVGHVYFAAPKTDEQRRTLARRLVAEGRVPGVLIRTADDAVTWYHAHGETSVPDGVPPLLPHPVLLRREIARDLAFLCRTPDAGDLVLVGWTPWSEIARSFAPERGAHGGFGPHETQGFLILPAHTPLPAGTESFVRPAALRAAARHHLGRETLPAVRTPPLRQIDLRLMTYNVHGCAGMDGRVSPRRIARVIKAQLPDVVALQELDLGHRRSRAEDQAAIIADELGLHVVFCPTITRGEEHYGHALLSRYPIHVVKRLRLPHDPKGWWQEPRAAIWARIEVGGRTVSVITTHLGLGARERAEQVRTLLGDDWIGSIPPGEPVVLCGDFNALPGSLPYRLAATRLHDVQQSANGRRPAGTFSSLQPLVRLDHIFVTSHFEREQAHVVRSDLTRVASDHLPLVADLRFAAAGPVRADHGSPGSQG